MTLPRVGVGVVVNRSGAILLVRRQGPHGAGTWSPPGGYPSIAAADELSEIRWFPRDDLPDQLFTPFERFLSGEVLRP